MNLEETMKSITVEGKTVNEAIQSALLQLGATENEVEIEVQIGRAHV